MIFLVNKDRQYSGIVEERVSICSPVGKFGRDTPGIDQSRSITGRKRRYRDDVQVGQPLSICMRRLPNFLCDPAEISLGGAAGKRIGV
jgi:hypothetical protein